MNVYTVVLFLHVTGAMSYFVGMGIALFGLFALRGARRVEQVRALTQFIGGSGPLMGVGVLLLLVTGLYMAITAWSLRTSWIAVALISLILLAPLGAALIEPRRRAIARLAQQTPDGLLSGALFERTHDGVLMVSTQTVMVLLLGIVFLMTNKPPLVESLVVMAVALVLGMASGALLAQVTGGRAPGTEAEASTTAPAHESRQPVA